MVQQKRTEKEKLKKVLLFFLLMFLAAALLAGILGIINYALTKDNEKQSALPIDAFYEANYEENIFENSAFMRLDHSVFYLEYGSGESLTEENYTSIGVASSFFYTYFQAIICGDCETYRSLLTEQYIKNYNPPEQFTMQMLYDIEVDRIQNTESTTYQGQTVMVYYFSVKYKIFQNNGTFRNDVGSNTSTTQYYELYVIDNQIYLNAVSNKSVISATR